MKTEINNQLKIIGHNLYLARVCQDMTMQDVADRTGLCRQTISSAEAGSGRIGLEVYLTIAEAVGVSLSAEVKPQLLRRAKHPVNIMNRLSGMTSTGVSFRVVEKKGKCKIEYESGSGVKEADLNFTFSNDSTKALPLYSYGVQTDIIKQQSAEMVKAIAEKRMTNGGNIRSKA